MKPSKKLSLFLLNLENRPLSEMPKEEFEKEMKILQLKMLRIQQGVFHKKGRVIIVFEGFDAAGKGGCIRKLTEALDPRSIKVIPIGPPSVEEQGKHWLYRFWNNLPSPGTIAIFDRSWYGRVLIEKVDKLASAEQIQRSYTEINEFEDQLRHDGITVIKIFLAITKDEQRKRFEDRLNDPYKQWKITMADIKARKKWNDYVKAVDVILHKCNPKHCPWYVIAGNSKKMARVNVLTAVTSQLLSYQKWIEKAAAKYEKSKLTKLLKKC